jgi:hypothetical protein
MPAGSPASEKPFDETWPARHRGGNIAGCRPRLVSLGANADPAAGPLGTITLPG